MRESERKRLVEMLKSGQPPFNPLCEIWIDKLADHLLDNGVIVPACKTGQKTYSKYGVELGEVKGFVFETYRGEDSLDYVLDWNYGDYDAFTDDDVGNTIFFSREEAEAKLKGVGRSEIGIDKHTTKMVRAYCKRQKDC